jgi:hypothetical protein
MHEISAALDAYVTFYDKLKKHEDGILGE